MNHRVVWTQHLPGETQVHLFTHGPLGAADRIVGDYEQWLTVCGEIPVKYRLLHSDTTRSGGAQLTEDQAVRLGLSFCTGCFPERYIGTEEIR